MQLLDTNTISYYLRGEPAVVRRWQAQAPASLAVPAVVEYELRYGLARLPAPAAQPRLAALEALLACLTVWPFDRRCAAEAARVRAALEAAGTSIGPMDTLIAATALARRATLVTRNVREFARVPGLQWVNWHDDA